MRKTIFALLLLLNAPVLGQEKNNEIAWGAFDYFRGQWLGHETGKAGVGKGERTYEYILGGRYLLSRNKSTFEPQEQNPKGEVHEDWAIFSRDKNRNTFVIREFNSEGFVNEFTLDTSSSGENTFVFVSEKSENAPPGLRARLTFKLENENHFTEIFELALPGKDFTVWLQNFWRRVPK
jgi:hypothetical protein